MLRTGETVQAEERHSLRKLRSAAACATCRAHPLCIHPGLANHDCHVVHDRAVGQHGEERDGVLDLGADVLNACLHARRVTWALLLLQTC